MWKILPATFLAIVLALTACESNLDRVLNDPNIPPGTKTTKEARSFSIPDDATGPLADILLNSAYEKGREFSIGDQRYRKLGHGTAEKL